MITLKLIQKKFLIVIHKSGQYMTFCTTIGLYYIMKDIVNKTFSTYSGGVMPQLKAEYWYEEKNALIVLKSRKQIVS